MKDTDRNDIASLRKLYFESKQKETVEEPSTDLPIESHISDMRYILQHMHHFLTSIEYNHTSLNAEEQEEKLRQMHGDILNNINKAYNKPTYNALVKEIAELKDCIKELEEELEEYYD